MLLSNRKRGDADPALAVARARRGRVRADAELRGGGRRRGPAERTRPRPSPHSHIVILAGAGATDHTARPIASHDWGRCYFRTGNGEMRTMLLRFLALAVLVSVLTLSSASASDVAPEAC